ncbi:ATP-binding protein [Streptomyces javensis]|uniref:sensor histidine kinase n=1 Tax=Streptomyces javensis TaxID=114698 RepID=UPI0033E2BD0A
MTQYLQDPALWALIAGTPLAATAIVRGRKARANLRQEKAELEKRAADLENNYAEAVQEAHNRAEEATKSALKSAMRTLQGLANEQQLAISKTQDKYGEHQLLQDLLEIDHMNSQFGRRAQSIAVLCDGWLGRQRAVASVYDVVRSAKGRIRHYTRVEIRSQSNFALVSRAVEPVALALAELLDNATSYSAPDSPIDITIRTVPKGVCVIIDDAGVGMNEEEKNRADKLLSATHATGVTGLGNPPQFGFAVIGVLAARYGFTVSVDSASPYGGVRAVVLLPEDLLTNMPEPEEQPTTHAPAAAVQPEPSVPTMASSTVSGSTVSGSTAGGLPKRRRKGAISIVPRTDTTAAARTSEETASIMGAFQRGTQSGRSAVNPNREGHDPQ